MCSSNSVNHVYSLSWSSLCHVNCTELTWYITNHIGGSFLMILGKALGSCCSGVGRPYNFMSFPWGTQIYRNMCNFTSANRATEEQLTPTRWGGGNVISFANVNPRVKGT